MCVCAVHLIVFVLSVRVAVSTSARLVCLSVVSALWLSVWLWPFVRRLVTLHISHRNCSAEAHSGAHDHDTSGSS